MDAFKRLMIVAVAFFGLVLTRECPPYETEYHPSSEPFFRSQEMADVAGFYRAFGLETAQAARERPDYLGLELEFMAFLLLKKRLALAAELGLTATTVTNHLAAMRRQFRKHVLNRLRDLTTTEEEFEFEARRLLGGTK